MFTSRLWKTLPRDCLLTIGLVLLGSCGQAAIPTPSITRTSSSPRETITPLPTMDSPTVVDDCSQIVHYPPESSESQEIVNAFIADFKAQWPTEYMAFEKVWGVYQLDDYVVIEGMVTDEERDVLIIQRVAGKYQLVARYIPFTPHSTDDIRATLQQQAPDAPPALILCIDLSRFVQ